MNLSPSDALALWHGVMLRALQDDLPDLTARQLTMLLHIYLAPPPHTVRGLAAALSISKPAVTRGLDRLAKLDFVRRRTDKDDRRSVLLERTVKGSVFLRDFAEIAVKTGKDLGEDG